MSTWGFVSVLLAVVGAGLVLVTVIAVLDMRREEPVGGWRSKRPEPQAKRAAPQQLRQLVKREQGGWSSVGVWHSTTVKLGQLEVELGGTAGLEHPDDPDEQWLHHRLVNLETLAGIPVQPAPPPPPRPLWKRIFR